MIQDPPQVPDHRGGDGCENPIERRPVIPDKPFEPLGSGGFEIARPNDGEAPDIAGALLENRAPVGLEDRVAVGAAGPDRVLVGIDDGEAGSFCDFFGDHRERIVGQPISGIENADAIVAGKFLGQRGPFLTGSDHAEFGDRGARGRDRLQGSTRSCAPR